MNDWNSTHIHLIHQQLQLPARNIKNTVSLLRNGATIPFVARYRKEVTGSMDEVQIEQVKKAWEELQELEKRRTYILQTIEEQGKLSPDLRRKIESTYASHELEDLYLPYKQKRKTRATKARELGLEPLARQLFEQNQGPLAPLIQPYFSEQVPDEAFALQGARDIIAEWINEDREARRLLRAEFAKSGRIQARLIKGKAQKGIKYKDYFDYSEVLKRCPSHRYLAILRGEAEGILRVQISPEEDATTLHILQKPFVKNNSEAGKQVVLALEDSYRRLLKPSISTEFRNRYKEKADAEAIQVFSRNLRQLLLAPPLGPQPLLAIDPGYRTGCKLVVLGASGEYLTHTNIFPHEPVKEVDISKKILKRLVHEYGLKAVAVGNGTAGKETLALLRGIDFEHPVEVFMVNEGGASVYSASEVARAEFPDKDITVRGAISIGRRLMDPLAELVKIDPKSIGVGQYQHDVHQTRLREALERVVESCVNAVGVNLNTASQHLLTFISGLGPAIAKKIVDYRIQNGLFQSLEELKKVPRLGAKAFEQCAGFLRIREGLNPLDNTGVHPERYQLVARMAEDLNCKVEDLIRQPNLRKQIIIRNYLSNEVGLPTLEDIVAELGKVGLDPRGKAKAFSFKEGIDTMEDVQPGMILPGIVTNITRFGAFVDIGIKHDGLIHISELTHEFVRDPADVIRLHESVQVKVLKLDFERKRIYLSRKALLDPQS